jgi:hypothetical protein
VQPITITTKIGNPLEDNDEVEDDVHEGIVRGILWKRTKMRK